MDHEVTAKYKVGGAIGEKDPGSLEHQSFPLVLDNTSPTLVIPALIKATAFLIFVTATTESQLTTHLEELFAVSFF